MPYRGSYTPPPRVDAGPPDGAQVIFDTVVGPNVRLKDNLIQLICCVVGAAIGGGIGAVLAPSGDKRIGVFLGIFGGLVVAVFLSGLVIGVVRFFTAVKAKRR